MQTNPAKTFGNVVWWLDDKVVLNKSAPGFIVGLSGTDSIVAFLAAYRALENNNKPERMMGVHFAPSDDFLADYPEAETHLWFTKEIIPWLREQAPMAKIVVDTSIDWRYDGLRWGKLADMSVIDMAERKMRPSDEKYWMVGTRNRTEDVLFNYSVASTIASVQPLVRLWKSEILDICEHLGVPPLAINKSCEADCICGREQLRAKFGRELDWVLNAEQNNDLSDARYNSVNPLLRYRLGQYIRERMYKGHFKSQIPYEPERRSS